MLNIFNRESITSAKALVIISVVLGHILEAILMSDGEHKILNGLYQSIYLVHMPFYFLLSGWLFKGAQPTVKYFVKKIKHLLIPYFTWLIIFNSKAIAGFFANLIQGNLAGEKALFYKNHFLTQLYGGMEVHGFEMILWFPMCLFFTQQLANFIMVKVNKNLIILVVVLAYILAFVNQYVFPEFHLPLALNIVCGALPLFFIGFFIKKYSLKSYQVWILVVLCLLTSVIFFVGNFPLTYHMRSAQYGMPVISAFAALGGFYIVLFVGNYISQNKRTFKVLQYVGKSSMTIMYLHALILIELYALNINNIYLLLIIGVLIPTLIHLIMARVNWLSKLFLGENKLPHN
ncbi:acyltransferase family protein [Winogradskyella litoriviva]|uniref:Acyltransferase family protein n=1 Tax=Winogradskyella litoriviva TaxID=1220182 RepID=A0ABX2E442_9FLAO|nr:acyltransferase family protein [Winogradskyella litoriviva]NRD23236.1 acyltransferase family protein [Winogradskyella litoriviva]